MFELRLKDLSENKRQEMLNIYIARKEMRDLMGGCPDVEERVSGHTQCFNCDECWIAAIENSFRNKSDDVIKSL
jgi:putative heme iron utilization protein